MKKAKGGLKQKNIDMTDFDLQGVDEEEMDKLSEYVSRAMEGINIAKQSQEKNRDLEGPGDGSVDREFWENVSERAESLGIDLVGYTEIDEHYIFEEEYLGYGVQESVLENGIVLGMEMEEDKIEKAPDPPAGIEAMRVYAELGEATNDLSEFLRGKGFRAQSFHPLGGPLLYPPLAEEAGLGELGVNGLLITPEFGPSQRFSVIATEAFPLPDTESVDLGVREYCESCEICVEKCPGDAILPYDEKIKSEDGKYIQSINNDKCFPHFYEGMGCSICIKVCPFFKK